MAENQQLATATFGGGCFWCTEAVFQNLRGVHGVKSGYAGGHVENPTYEQVCTATTGHAEVIQITYDPAVISYEDLLEVFFTTHDPTTPNRQGNDVGPQYRSVIFYHDAEQERIARDVIKSVNDRRIWNRADRDGGVAAADLLSGGGLSRRLLRPQSGAALLSGDHRAEGGEAAEAAYGQASGVKRLNCWSGRK